MKAIQIVGSLEHKAWASGYWQEDECEDVAKECIKKSIGEMHLSAHDILNGLIDAHNFLQESGK